MKEDIKLQEREEEQKQSHTNDQICYDQEANEDYELNTMDTEWKTKHTDLLSLAPYIARLGPDHQAPLKVAQFKQAAGLGGEKSRAEEGGNRGQGSHTLRKSATEVTRSLEGLLLHVSQ